MGLEVEGREPRDVEKRRSPRHLIELPVEVIEGRRTRVVSTVDVSRHGLFLATDEPPRERYLVQLSIKLPSGPLPATAFVSRTVPPGSGRSAGVGVQFFALSAASKERWDAFVYQLAGLTPPKQQTHDLARRVPDGATFLIKLKHEERLLEFYERNVATNGLYMATPVIKETGAEVALVVIHPETEQEFILGGKVARVCTEAPKGMEIKLSTTEEEKAAFLEFVTTGLGPDGPDTSSQERRQKIEQLPIVAGDEIDTEDLSIDIIVDDSALEESEQFVWDEVSETSGVLTFDITEYDDLQDDIDTSDFHPNPPGEQGPEIDLGPPPRTNSTLFEVPADLWDTGSVDLPRPARDRGATVVPQKTSGLYERALKEVVARVFCRSCDADFGTIDFGDVEAPLGLLASRRPYWCPKDRQVVSVLRLDPLAERRAALERLGETAGRQPVPLSIMFEVAELATSPRCPTCGGNVRLDELVRALVDQFDALRQWRAVELKDVTCPACAGTGLHAEATTQG